MRVALIASGGGSNAGALMEAMQAPDFGADPVLVLSNNEDAGVLARARSFGVASEVVDHRPFKGDREAFDAKIGQVLSAYDVEVVCLAGFLRIMSEDFVRSWEGRLLNIHPSLLPKYPGLNTHQRAIEAGDKEAGCTVHMVIPELDAGPILGQRNVPIHADDTADTLAARVLKEEHILYPEMLRSFVENR